MSLTPKTDYVASSRARLLSQFLNKPRIEAILAAFAEEAQAVEAGLLTLYTPRFLANASGAMLDVYGALVGQARGALSDASYRLWIGARMAVNRSSGTSNDILRIARQLVAPTNSLTLTEHYPAGFALQVAGGATAFVDDIYQLLYSAKMGGVGFRFITQDGADAERFVFAGGVGLGFAGHASDWLGPRVDTVPTGVGPATVGPVTKMNAGIGPPTLGPVTVVEGPGISTPPINTLTGGPVPFLLGTITISMVDDVDFAWTASNGYGGDQNIGQDGPGVPFELYDTNMTAGTGIGINVEFIEGEPFEAADGWAFTVTEGTSTSTTVPTVEVIGGVPVGLGEVTMTVTSMAGNGTFTWTSTGGAGNFDGQPLYAPDGLGGFVPVELDDTEGGTGPAGITVLFGAGQPYLVDDAWAFTVTDNLAAVSTPPTLAVTGPLAVTGRVTLRVTTGLGGYWFNYQRPDGTISSAQSMARGTAVPLRNVDLSLMGLSVTWPNVASIYTGARHAWRGHEADATVGGRWVDVR